MTARIAAALGVRDGIGFLLPIAASEALLLGSLLSGVPSSNKATPKEVSTRVSSLGHCPFTFTNHGLPKAEVNSEAQCPANVCISEP